MLSMQHVICIMQKFLMAKNFAIPIPNACFVQDMTYYDFRHKYCIRICKFNFGFSIKCSGKIMHMIIKLLQTIKYGNVSVHQLLFRKYSQVEISNFEESTLIGKTLLHSEYNSPFNVISSMLP